VIEDVTVFQLILRYEQLGCGDALATPTYTTLSDEPHVAHICFLSSVDTHTVALKPVIGKYTRHYSWYCARGILLRAQL